jgi:glucan 1,3-beta-glucosidase
MEADDENLPYVPGSARYLDDAFDMAAAHDIRVIVSIHAARGSQNGFDHSAPCDRFVLL